eukprot:TRINITY_DN8025_c0_g1_i14.p1 TRINITY_DN8025_c0_g1~~TRINITY_DN8025_c0_g1_i14.p1  ORF type:complete len:353 (+),score=63.48 TRINITY_DN8025_c0_g1_i14:110-1168(+)
MGEAVYTLLKLPSFAELAQKVSTLFKTYCPENYKLYYRDADNDLIVVTNQEDYDLALSQSGSELVLYASGSAENACALIQSTAPKFSPVQSCYVSVETELLDTYACLECKGRKTNRKGTKRCRVCEGSGRVPEDFLESIRNVIRTELPAALGQQFTVAVSQLIESKKESISKGLELTTSKSKDNKKKLDLRSSMHKEASLSNFHLEPGEEFKQLWTLRNTGTDSWPADTTLNNVNGYNLQAVATPVGEIKPGNTVSILITGTAPSKPGRYVAYYQLTHGKNASESFGVKPCIDVTVLSYEHNHFHFKCYSRCLLCLCRGCLLYTSPSPRDRTRSRMPSSACKKKKKKKTKIK